MRKGFAISKGFTIIELMIVVAVVAIMVSIAAPNLRATIVTQRVKTAASNLHTDFTLARSEAIKRNASVSIVPVDPFNWHQGWSVKFGTQVISSQEALPDVTIDGPASTVSYLGTGRISGTAGIYYFLKATGYPEIIARCVQIEPSGRPSVRMDGNRNSADGQCN